MTTKETWKLRILIAGMLGIAFIINHRGIEGYLNQPPARPPNQSTLTIGVPPPLVAPPPSPQYPIHKTIPVNQNRWCDEISVNTGEQLEWTVLDKKAWLDTRVNRIEEFRQFPKSDSRWRPLKIDVTPRTLAFRITAGTSVQAANVELTIQKAIGADFFAREKILSSVSPSLTDAGDDAGPPWPNGTLPTRYGKFPPENMSQGPGGIAADWIYPIEDVTYRIEPGWTILPLVNNGNRNYEATSVPEGFRLRSLDPDHRIYVEFKMTRKTTQAAATPQGNQGNHNWNSQAQPIMHVAPNQYPQQQPSYYPTTPSGPSYYPSSPTRSNRPKP